MNKDVIYIDVEDDITAIIGKVKASKEKVVALVPPKRIGLLQSAVNLRLLDRAAKQGDKHLVLITNNHALMALAAAAALPVAKNLQSKPELAQIPALEVDDGEDVIDGAALPVGEHAKMADNNETDEAAEMAAVLAAGPQATAVASKASKPRVKSGVKVPNFNTFRKKLFFAIGGGILLIAFLVWAIFIAPHATVVIGAKTTSSSINLPVSLSTTADTSLDKSTIHAVENDQSDTKSVDFTATGTKDVGSKATGTVEFSTNDAATAINGVTIPAGTKLQSSSGLVFTTDSTVTINQSNFQGAPTGVTAVENGSKYNAASGAMSGAPGNISANLTGPTAGGLTKNITIVTAADVQKAKTSLVAEDTDTIKNDLKAKFGSDVVVVDESFAIDYTDVTSTPAVGGEAPDGSAKLSSTLIYRLYGANKSELSTFLDSYMATQLKGTTDQQVYSNGSDGAVFQEASKQKDGAKATLIATAQVGPKIDDNAVKAEAKGKRFGEIQQSIEAIQGVDSVQVKFFPFWISKVPNNDKRISVEFKLDESK